MDSGTIRIGLLYSTSGPYRTIGRAMLNGALLALEQVNADPALPFTLEPVVRDPGGRNDRYAELARWMLADEHLFYVVGCYTSSSRKEVLPFFEKYDGLLWYPSHYEGFESSEHVIYTGAAPNQHIVPLADYMLGKFGRSAYLVGSHYIWAWENNKIMRVQQEMLAIARWLGGRTCCCSTSLRTACSPRSCRRSAIFWSSWSPSGRSPS